MKNVVAKTKQSDQLGQTEPKFFTHIYFQGKAKLLFASNKVTYFDHPKRDIILSSSFISIASLCPMILS